MNSITLPNPIQIFVDATNASDTNAFLDAFTDSASLNDWGREFQGRQGIAQWNQTDNIGKQSKFETVAVAPGSEPDSYVVTFNVSGNGFNGTSPLHFQLQDGKIARLVISAD